MNKILLKIRNKLLKDKKGTLECFLLVCIIGAIVLPIMICAFYALPAADDFSHANETRIALQNNYICGGMYKNKRDIPDLAGNFYEYFSGKYF